MSLKRLANSALAIFASSLCLAIPSLASEENWTGLYGTGYLGMNIVSGDATETGLISESSSFDATGLNGGVGFGGQYDLGDIVFGLEADMSLASATTTVELKNTSNLDYDWFATARAKAGYDFGNTLVYATGGLAMTQLTVSNAGNGSKDVSLTGWTAGLGAEHKLSDSLSLKAEALFSDYGKDDFKHGTNWNIDTQQVTVRAGLSFYLN